MLYDDGVEGRITRCHGQAGHVELHGRRVVAIALHQELLALVVEDEREPLQDLAAEEAVDPRVTEEAVGVEGQIHNRAFDGERAELQPRDAPDAFAGRTAHAEACGSLHTTLHFDGVLVSVNARVSTMPVSAPVSTNRRAGIVRPSASVSRTSTCGTRWRNAIGMRAAPAGRLNALVSWNETLPST